MVPALDPRKTIASIFLLPDCQMACRFCASELDFDVATFERVVDLLDGLAGHGVGQVVFGGGEPFLWPHDVVEAARAARRRGFHVQVCTNGVDLPADFARVRAIDRYLLPLEADEAALHDRLRVARGGHHATVERRIEELVEAGREFTLSTVVTALNLAALPALADRLAALTAVGASIHAWHLYRFLPVGRGGRRAAALAPDREAYLDACRRLKAGGLPFPVYRRDDMIRSSSVEFFWFEGGVLQVGSQRS